MAQLKVKQISDFVSAVASVHNGAIGTGTVTGISIAKSEAIASALSSAEAKDVVRANATAGFIATAKGEAVDAGKLDATSKADAAEAAAILAAENKDVVRASATTGFIATAKSEAISTASGDASAKADAALNAAVLAAENKDVSRASATAGFIATAKSQAILAGEADATDKADQALVDAKVDATNKSDKALADAKTYSDIQKGRITTLLGGSTAALDTFGEINTFIAGLSEADVTLIDAVSLNTDKVGVTTATVSGAGALMDSEVSNLAQVKAFDSADYDVKGAASAAQSAAISAASGDASAKADAALNAAVLAAENKDVARATATAGFISDAKGEAIAAGEADATSKANAAQANAIASAEGKDVVRAATAAKATVDAQAAAILAAENKDVVRAEATVGLISDAKGEAINAASADATSKANAAQAAAATEAGRLDGLNAVASTNYTDGRETSILSVLRGEISSLAGTDKLEQIATFTNKTSFSLAEGVKLDNLDVLVYVNGLQIHRSAGGEGYTIAAGGKSFAVEGLGYELEENDHIVVIGIKA